MSSLNNHYTQHFQHFFSSWGQNGCTSAPCNLFPQKNLDHKSICSMVFAPMVMFSPNSTTGFTKLPVTNYMANGHKSIVDLKILSPGETSI